jgi:RNA polymerase sigma-70 factor
MGPDDTIRADEAALARSCLEGDAAALAEFERRFESALRSGLEAGVREWGDLGLELRDYARRIADTASRDRLRAPDSLEPIGSILSRLALADLYLAAGCALGHDAAWRRFDGSFGSFLSAVVRALARSPRDTEEILAGLYSDLFFPRRRGGVEQPSSLARYGGRASLKTWLRSILFTRVQDFYSRRRRSPLSLDQDATASGGAPPSISEEDRALLARELPEETLARRDLVRRVVMALEESVLLLEPEERLAFHAHFVEERTIEEIAKLFRAHRATIGRRLKRARTKIVRTIETRLRLESGAARREFRGAIPDLAKELQFDWARALGQGPAPDKDIP